MRPPSARLACLLAILCCGGCASLGPAGDAERRSPPAPVPEPDGEGGGVGALVDELGERVGRGVEAERRRVDAFPDLPDPGGSRDVPGAGGVDEGEVGDGPTAGPGPEAADGAGVAEGVPGVVTERVLEQRRAAFNPYVLTAHRQNFIMPAYVSTRLNEGVYRDNDIGYGDDLQAAEMRFQISLKAQINGRDLFLKDDSLSFGITLEAWWQVYNAELSRPFRETNYTPEIFYLKPLLWGPFGGSTTFVLGLSHQSNGQAVGLSRSWNRIYTGLVYENGGFVARLRPWYRIPEDEKDSPDDPGGDDNPDILDFMGHGDLSLYLRRSTREYAALARLNTATGHGAARLAYTFPLTPRFRGIVEYFVGYGDSLVDYDHFQQRFGVGIALTDLL